MFDRQQRGTINFEDFGAIWKYVTDWQACFRSFDRDNSGNIDGNELKTALSSIKFELKKENTFKNRFFVSFQNQVLATDFRMVLIICCYANLIGLEKGQSILMISFNAALFYM